MILKTAHPAPPDAPACVCVSKGLPEGSLLPLVSIPPPTLNSLCVRLHYVISGWEGGRGGGGALRILEGSSQRMRPMPLSRELLTSRNPHTICLPLSVCPDLVFSCWARRRQWCQSA